jgi:hypothetical protein
MLIIVLYVGKRDEIYNWIIKSLYFSQNCLLNWNTPFLKNKKEV